MKYQVYLITNTINDLKYVGITVQKLKTRLNQHKMSSSNSTALYNAIVELGEDNFNISLLQECVNEEEMEKAEIYYIEKLKTFHPHGYNLTTGGTHTTFTQEVKNRMSNLAISRWQDPTYRAKNLQHIKEQGLKRSRPVVGVNINSGKIKRLKHVKDHNTDISASISQRTVYTKNHVWFYDEGQPDDFFINQARERLGTDFGKYNKGTNSWNKSDRLARVQAMKDGTKHRQKPIISIHIHTGQVTIYDGINEMVRQTGKAISSVYACLTEKAKTGQKHCWFYYDNNLGKDHYVALAEKILGGFDKSYTIPIQGTYSGKMYEFTNVYEASKISNIQIKTIRRVLRKDKGYHTIRGWKFEYKQ